MQGLRRRADGRAANQLRPLAAEFGPLASSDGSARLTSGGTSVLCAVHGPRPPRTVRAEDARRAVFDVQVVAGASPSAAAAWSSDAAAAAAAAAARERCAALEDLLRAVFERSGALLLAAHPRTVVSLAVYVERDDGGAAACAVNAAALALLDAGVAMRCLPAAATLGLLSNGRDSEAGADVDAGANVGAEANARGPGEETGPAARPFALDLLLAEEATSDLRALAVFSPDELADATLAPLYLDAVGELGDGDSGGNAGGGGSCGCSDGGGAGASGLPMLLAAARAACATVAAFLRLAARQKVLRDAVNFDAIMGGGVEVSG